MAFGFYFIHSKAACENNKGNDNDRCCSTVERFAAALWIMP